MNKVLIKGGYCMADFGKYLRSLRENRGLGVNQLALMVNASPSLISKVENGKRGAPKTSTLDELSKVLRISQIEIYFMAGHTSILGVDPEFNFSENAYRYMTEEDLEIIKESKKKTYKFRGDVRKELKEDIPNILGIRLKKLIHKNGNNYGKTSKELGIEEYVIHNILSGDYIPDYQFVNKIANYFDVSTDYLLGNNNQVVEKSDRDQIIELINKVATEPLHFEDFENMSADELRSVYDMIKMFNARKKGD